MAVREPTRQGSATGRQAGVSGGLTSQRGDFDEALALVDEAEKRSADREGRLASLRKAIEEQRAGAETGEVGR